MSDADYELAPLDGPAADTVNAAGVSSPSGLTTYYLFRLFVFWYIIDTTENGS